MASLRSRTTLVAAALTLALAAPPAHAGAASFDGSVSQSGPRWVAHAVEVAAAGTLEARLEWRSPGANLGLFLVDPDGTHVKAVTRAGVHPKTISFAVAPGRWKLGVKAITGASSYTLTVTTPGGDTPPPPPPGGRVAAFHGSFGFPGPAGLYAYGLDWDPTDDTILVGDYWNYRVWRYTTAGKRIGLVSTSAKGGMSGGITAPYDIEADTAALDGAGRAALWVADQGSSRIVQFGHGGAWMRTIGKLNAGQAAGPGGRAYPQGCGGGRMQIPTHILVDPVARTINVADPRCRAVYVFDHPTGRFLRAFNWTGFAGDTGVGTPIPRGIAQDGDGRIYVAEFNSRRIAVFDRSGRYLYASARVPSVAGDTMNDPRGLDVDRAGGFVYVVGAFHNKVYQFRTTAAGAPIHVKRWRNIAGDDRAGSGKGFDAIRFPAVDGSGHVYVGETWGSESYGYGVEKFDPRGAAPTAALLWTTPPLAPPRGGFNQQNGIALDPSDDSLFVVDTFEQRVQKFDTSSTCASAASCPAWSTQWGSRQASRPRSDGFGYPRALTFGDDGLVWVGDNNNAVLAFRPDGSFVHRYGSQGKGRGQFSGGVQGIRVEGGRVYATDVAGCRLQVFDRAKLLAADNATNAPAGTLIASLGTCGSGPNQMRAPRGIAVDAGGDAAFVAETGGNRVSRWDLATGRSTVIRPTCAGKGLAQPWGVTWDPGRDWLYVGDVKNARVVRMRPDGTSCQVVVTQADLPPGMRFLGANFVEFDSRGRMYVSDNSRHVYAFTLAD